MSALSLQTRNATRELLTLAWPVVMARLGVMVMGLTDAIVVGNFSSRELAFHSLAWAPTSVVLTTAVGLMMGVQVMAARLIGEGRQAEVGAVLRRGVALALQIGFGAAVLLVILGPVGLGAAGLEDGLGEGASPALIVFSLSLPFYLLSATAQLFIEALGKPRMSMAAIWVANVVNLGLNLLLVPDLMGIGVDGAVASAWATFGARAALAAFLLIYILRLPEARALGIFSKPRRDPVAAQEQLKIGAGAGSSYFIEVTAFAAMTLFAGRLGANETAAWAVVLNVSAIVFMIPLGLSSATAVLVGRAYGASDGPGVLRAGLVGVGVVAVLTLLVALLVWPGAGLVVGAYGRDPTLMAIAVPALILATLFFVADGIQVVAASANRAAADVWWPTIIHVTAYGGIMMPLGWWLAPRFGIDGLVWAVIVASLVSATLLTGRFVRIASRFEVRGARVGQAE